MKYRLISETNKSNVSFTVLGIFAVIFLSIYFINSSNWYTKFEYRNFKELQFKSVIVKKLDEHPIKHNQIYLKKAQSIYTPREIFNVLKLGDSVIKKFNSDSIIFKTKNKIIYYDKNKFLRNKMLRD